MSAPDWLQITKDAYAQSTSYVDSNYRKIWENNLRLFQSRHPADSKYNSDAYKHRSKVFRPKTRSVERKNEAATAAAYFSNLDVVDVTSAIPDPQQQGPVVPGQPPQGPPQNHSASAAIMKELLNYRLTKSVPWFQTVIGAFQDAQIMGAVCSKQDWEFKRGKDGKVKQDKPRVSLRPMENIRFDPGADWIDPVNSSPYWLDIIPMYVRDVQSLMDNADEKTGKPKWKKYSLQEISAVRMDFDSTRQLRDKERVDPATETSSIKKQFDLTWVIENYCRWDDDDYVWWTLGTELLLTDPVPIQEVYFTGERPYVLGVAQIEAHRNMPSSPVELGADLQRETNEVGNQFLDNVKLVLNKRYIVKRGKNVDTASLNRNVPGGVTMADDPEGDIRELSWGDVTPSALEAQNRINVDFDDLVGNFSSGSVSTNRQLNETVGGLALLSQGANVLVEFGIRTFTETWTEKVLRQLMKLEAKYESDLVVLNIAAEKAQLFERYGVNDITDELLNNDLTLTVNVGMNATDPMKKFQKFMAGIQGYSQVVTNAAPGLNIKKVGTEVFALLGYKNAAEFLSDQDPQLMAMQQQMQQMQEKLQQAQGQVQQAVGAAQAAQGQLQQAKIAAAQERLASAQKDHAAGMALAAANQNVATKDQQLKSKGVDDRVKSLMAVHESELIEAQRDLTQAQTILTLEQASKVPDPNMEKKAESGDE